jgi:hypothetical protein
MPDAGDADSVGEHGSWEPPLLWALDLVDAETRPIVVSANESIACS